MIQNLIGQALMNEGINRLTGLLAPNIAPASDPPLAWADHTSDAYCDMPKAWNDWDKMVEDVHGQTHADC